jgi:hypothetical protein
MTSHKPDRKSPSSAPTADSPGRPKDSGSRQQTHPDQNLQSGSHELDKSAGKGGVAARNGPKPPGAK